MGDKTLYTLYQAYLDNSFEGAEPITGDNYEEVEEVNARLQAFEDKLHIDGDNWRELEDDIVFEMSAKAECIGFINGLKVGARLAKALFQEGGEAS